MAEEVNKENEQANNPDDDIQLEQKVAELEQMVANRDDEIATLKKSAGELKEQLSTTNKSLAEAIMSYKDRVIQTHPGVTMELINGDTVEAIDKSLEKALNLIGRVRKSVEKEISLARIPAGAPGRQAVDLSTLSPREKIQYAIGGKK